MIRDYIEDNYATLCKWWEAQKFPAPHNSILPATGYIANEAAAGFLYITNSPLCWLEWVVVNPEAEKKVRNESINEVIEYVCDRAAFCGATQVFTSSNYWPFIARLKKSGFEVGDTNTTQLFRRVR